MGLVLIENAEFIYHQITNTVNDENLEWLKFGGFGKLIKFAKLSSANLL